MTIEDKRKRLKALMKEMGNCERCRLKNGRKRIVFGDGNPEAKVMFVGEAPGREEDEEGIPFVGKAGRLLTKVIERCGFKREAVYISNVVKCRPPKNRLPLKDEVDSCLPYLLKQIEIIRPKVILALGRLATKTLLGRNLKMGEVRGKVFKMEGFVLIPTFHTSFILRNPNMEKVLIKDIKKALRFV